MQSDLSTRIKGSVLVFIVISVFNVLLLETPIWKAAAYAFVVVAGDWTFYLLTKNIFAEEEGFTMKGFGKFLVNAFVIFCFVAAMAFFTGCTDATKASFGAIGEPGKVQCYSGGKLIYEGVSTGRIATVEYSDGWEFCENGTNSFIRVSGDCLIIN